MSLTLIVTFLVVIVVAVVAVVGRLIDSSVE